MGDPAMSLWKALRDGITTATRIPAPLVLWFVAYLAAALVLTLPVVTALNSWVGHHLAARDLARDFDGLLLIEPVLNSSAMLQGGQITPGAQAEGQAASTTLLAMGATVLVAGPLGTLFNAVLGGGVLLTYAEGHFAWRRFLWGVWHWLLAFLVLAVLWCVCAVFVVALGAGLLAVPASALQIPALVLTALVYVASVMTLEYARAIAIVEGTRNIFRALGRAAAFMVRQPVQAVGLYLLMTAPGLALILLYSGLIAPSIPFEWGLAAVAAQQLFIVARLWMRLAHWASQVALYRQWR